MNVIIKDVFIDAASWITVKLKSGRIIDIFDPECSGLENYINQEKDILIIISFFSIIDCKNASDDTILEGKFTGDYIIPGRYFSSGESFKGFLGFENEDGIFLITPSRAEKYGFKKGKRYCLKVSRFDLLEWIFK